MSARTLVAVTLAMAGVISAENGGLTAAAPEDPEVYRGETTAVVVDVVVRDRRGRPILDLQKSDFELFEDGVRQEIGVVTLVAPPDARASGRTPPPLPSGGHEAYAPAPDAPTFLAMVFDQMSLEARAQAYKGALAYVDSPGGGRRLCRRVRHRAVTSDDSTVHERSRGRACGAPSSRVARRILGVGPA